MPVDQTSLLAYEYIQPEINLKQRIVYDVIRSRRVISNEDISRILGWPINTVTPRVKELRDEGLVECAGHIHSPRTGRLVNVWRLKEVDRT